MSVNPGDPSYVRPDGTLTELGKLWARDEQRKLDNPPIDYTKPGTYMQSPYAPKKSVPLVPYVEPAPILRKPLSLDAKIGLASLFLLFAYSGFSLTLALWGIGIFLAALAYKWLWRHAPITGGIIGLFFMSIVLALLGSGRGRRRW